MLLAFAQNTGEALIRDASLRLDKARSISFTRLSTTEEFPKDRRQKFWLKNGGFFRCEVGTLVDMSDPGQGWTYDSITQVTVFEDLKLDQPIPDNKFKWNPPVGWKRVEPGKGGWQ